MSKIHRMAATMALASLGARSSIVLSNDERGDDWRDRPVTRNPQRAATTQSISEPIIPGTETRQQRRARERRELKDLPR